MITMTQRRSRPSSLPVPVGNPPFVPPGAFLSAAMGDSDSLPVLVGWGTTPGHGAIASEATALFAGYGATGVTVTSMSAALYPHAPPALRTTNVSMASGMGQSLALSADVIFMAAFFGAVVNSVWSLASTQLAQVSDRRVLSDDDIAMFDRALIASSKHKYDITG